MAERVKLTFDAAGCIPRCFCGRFVRTGEADTYGWFMYGEHGSEEGYVCPRCLETWSPSDGRGRGTEAGYCGVHRSGRSALASQENE